MSYSSQVSLIFTGLNGSPPAVFVKLWGGQFQLDNENRATWVDTLIEQSDPVPYSNLITFALQNGPDVPSPFSQIALSVHLAPDSGPLFRSGYMSELPPPAPSVTSGIISIAEIDEIPGSGGAVPIEITQAQVDTILAQDIPLPFTPPGHSDVLVIALSATLTNPTTAFPLGSISLVASGTAAATPPSESLSWTYTASLVLSPSTQQFPSAGQVISVGIAEAAFSLSDPNGPDPISAIATALLNSVLNEFATEQISQTVLQLLAQQINNAALATAIHDFGLPAGTTSLPLGIVLSLRQALVAVGGQGEILPAIHLVPAIGCFGPLSAALTPPPPPPPPPPLGNLSVTITPAPRLDVAQNYVFFVTDKATGRAVNGATVSLVNSAGSVRGTSGTDGPGKIEFQDVDLTVRVVADGGKVDLHPVTVAPTVTVTADKYNEFRETL